MTDAAPLSWTQERLWFEEQLRPGDVAYNMPVVQRVRGPLDTALLQRALDLVVARHDALRTVFDATEGTPTQRVLPGLRVTAEVRDLRGLPDPAAAGDDATRREARAPFDLAAGPLLRALVLRVADDEHLLSMTVHHIVFDGWSFGILFKELSQAYAALDAGTDPGFRPLRGQFADAVRAERAELTDDAVDELVAWWRAHLDEVPRVLDLPTDRPRPAVRAQQGATRRLGVDAATAGGMREVARRHEATPFMALLSAFGVVLARQTGQDRLIVGTPAATRGAGTRDVVGCFLNTLPLRVDTGAATTFADLLRQVRDDALTAFARQRVPFARLVSELAPERDLSRSRLVQVFFNVLPPTGTLDLPGCTVEPLPAGDIDNKFDLTLYVAFEDDGTLTLEAVYDTALYDAPRVDALLEQVRGVLTQAAAEPATPLAQFTLATPGSAARQPEIAARPAAARTESLLDRLARHAAAHPDRPALIGADRVWTYAEVEAATEGLARRLRALGVGTGDVVAVHATRDPAAALGVLATVKAGAVFALLDARYPEGALAARAAELAPRAWLDCAPGHPLPAFAEGPVLRPEPGPPPVGPTGAAPGPDDPAYVAFTSGTTGRPRAVLGTHRPVAHFLDWYVRSFDLGPDDRFAVLSGLGHDPFLRDVLTPVWAGGAAVFPAADVRDTAAIGAWLGTAEITVAHLTPALGRAVADHGEHAPALRLLGFGGDILPGRTVRSWSALAPGARILNMYGATETPQAVSVHTVDTSQPVRAAVPLGPGIDGVQLFVLAGDRPAGIGEIGEIVVRTPYLARYASEDGDPSGFVPDPLSGRSDTLVYRTGDLARLRPDGLIDHLGRADRQLKVRGFRVEPTAIEEALATLPGIARAVVLAVPEPTGDHRLVGHLATGAARPDLAAVRAGLARLLPEYLIPSAFVVQDTLPLTANGKVDHAALRALGHEEAATGAYAEPSGPVQRRIAEVWREVLGRERVGADDDFFALGGHSLLLTRVLARLRGGFVRTDGELLQLRDLFEQPTVATLGALLRAADGEDPVTAARAPLTRVDPELPAPLSWTQERLWFEEQLRPADTAYNMPLVLRLRGPLDLDALQSAVDAVVERHAVLRSVFELRDGSPVQRAVPGARVLVERGDVRSAADPASAAIAAAMRSVKEPFDLGKGPLLRAFSVRVGDEEHLFALTVHHIVFDGWSFGVLLKDLSRAYADSGAIAAGPVLQFADVARWERADLAGEALEDLLTWWRGHLDGVPHVLELPTDRPRPAVQGHRGARRPLVVDAETAAGLRALAAESGSTLFMALLSAYAVVLSRYTGQRRLLVGTPVANRPRPEFEDLAGCFLNTVALRVDLDGDPDFRELLARVRQNALGAFAHQRVPFGKLVSELVPDRDLSRNPVAQVLFALQNVELGTLDVPGLDAELVEVSEANSQFDLNLRMIDTGREIQGWLDYDVDLFDAATVERFVEHFTHALAAVVADPHVPVAAVDILGAAERARLTEHWNDTATGVLPEATLTQLLSRAGEGYASRTALRFEGREVGYAELHRRANRLAHRLRELGVGPDTVVGVRLDRSVELMVALLAVLKAGGAYLPLDTGYPEDRLAFMLADSGAPVLLTGPGDAPRPQGAGGPTVVVVDEDVAAGHPETEPAPLAGPDHLAYVIYTSGSTGRPKGVQVPHRGIVNRLLWMQDAYQLGASDAVLQKTPVSFDVSVWELFWPLLTGARLVLAGPGGHRDPLYLADLIRREAVTVCHFVPPMLDAFLRAGQAGACASLRLVVCSGEALPAELARRFHQVVEARLENLYGPTEASVDVTRFSVPPGRPGASLPIGTPIAHTRTYVLDDRLAPVPTGVPGELYLGGVQLARGYGGRPGLTADRFVPDPFGPPGSRLYRTGDVARWTADGVLDYLGRSDHQVKVRGFRIELGEIEAALLDQEGVAQAVVIVREDDLGDRRIVAYLTSAASTPVPDRAVLRAVLAGRLPEHMLPSAFVALDALPLGPNGKVDRAALPAPAAPVTGRGAYIPPSTPDEEKLAALWAEVLRLDRVGVGDNFFEIGGDSMHAVRITGLAREQGLDIPLQRFFTSPTVADLARRPATASTAAEQPREVSAFGLLSAEDLARLRS
ncbi:non-ribosomal peptide synthetase [Streptomyces sp. NBC_01304]|uniref:non-ribosomal peptide synthetase n=1 Tax=Streptomyces sp. NBC_01304 TaxID=2903818 RepID=UPI002E0D5B8D|nr:non-ribosomal peptide synthetase [Streptomyces sp. NBC_01304]WSJ83877.1 amino acid adenylation domain-containing protein [Streptomyces sp. NBC_01304]